MTEPAKPLRFDDLPLAEQHTVETWIDELTRRDTVVDTLRAEHDDGDRPSQVYLLLPSADLDRRSADAVLQMAR